MWKWTKYIKIYKLVSKCTFDVTLQNYSRDFSFSIHSCVYYVAMLNFPIWKRQHSNSLALHLIFLSLRQLTDLFIFRSNFDCKSAWVKKLFEECIFSAASSGSYTHRQFSNSIGQRPTANGTDQQNKERLWNVKKNKRKKKKSIRNEHKN